MSDLGLLSKQYQELNQLLRQIRNWVTIIKRIHYKIGDPIEGESVQDAKTNLAQIVVFLQDVIPEEDEGKWNEDWLKSLPLPVDVVDKLREAHVSDQPLYLDQLKKLSVKLEKKEVALNETDITLLDEIMLVASADMSAVFRRMMRWA